MYHRSQDFNVVTFRKDSGIFGLQGYDNLDDDNDDHDHVVEEMSLGSEQRQ